MSSRLETAAECHIKLLRRHIGHLQLLEPAFMVAAQDPARLAGIFRSYLQLTHESLTPSEVRWEVIMAVSEQMQDAPRRSVKAILTQIGLDINTVLTAVDAILDPGSQNYTSGLEDLAERMNQGWKMKESNVAPQDGDHQSDQAIWGFTRGAANPWVDVHFVIGHLLERVATHGLQDTRLQDLSGHKDWLNYILASGVALGMAEATGAGYVLGNMWTQHRPYGLGWLSSKRQTLYTANSDLLMALR